jgi:hypothetical protein
MTEPYLKKMKKEALLMTETIAVMDHLLKTYGLLLSDADFAVVREGLHALSDRVDHTEQERQLFSGIFKL